MRHCPITRLSRRPPVAHADRLAFRRPGRLRWRPASTALALLLTGLAQAASPVQTSPVSSPASPAAAAHTHAPALLRLTPAQQRQAGLRTLRPAAAAAGPAPGASAPAAAQIQLLGTVVAPPQATELVSAPLAGVVQAVLVGTADAVRAGQGLVQLHSPALMGLQREYLQLQLQTQQADDRLRRDQQLADEGIIATARLNDTRNLAQQARLAALERRQSLRMAGLSEGQIQALVTSATVQPGLGAAARASGRVAEVLVQPGQQVEAGAPLVKVVRPLPLALALNATLAQAAQLRPGAAVQVAGCAVAGTVRGVVPLVQGSNQAAIVQVALARAADCVQPNQAVSASVALAPDRADARQLPAAALWQLQGQAQVFLVTAGGYRPQAVTLLSRDGAQVTVAGLPPQAEVVVAGVVALKGAWVGLGEAQALPAEAPPPKAAAPVAASGAR